jgi:hypothetical protein
MAAFSRGIRTALLQHSFRLPSTIRTAAFTPRPQYAPSHISNRFFSSSIPRQARLPLRTTSPTPSIPSYMTRDPVLRQVMSSREPVLLYKEPNPWKNYGRTYFWAIMATGVGMYSFYFARVHVPKDSPFFVLPTYLFVGAAFIIIGVHIFQRPVRRISTLEVLPAKMGGQMRFRLRGRKYPFLAETEMTTEFWEPVISEKTNPMKRELIEAERARKQSLSEGLGSFGYFRMVVEFLARALDQKTTSFFNRFKYFVLQFGQATIQVRGMKWKVDCRGYLLEDGQGMFLL